MAEQMKVSVVITTYNRGYIVGDAVESVLKQSYANLEILVVDDGSSDNTQEVVERFKSDKIRYIRHDRNRGCSAAYNTGISAATGNLIGILDSDDIWKPDYLEKLVDLLVRHPEVDLVFSDISIQDGPTFIPSTSALMKSFSRLLQTSPKASEYIFSSRQMYVCLLEEVPIKPSAVVVRRETFEKTGFFDEAPSSAAEGTPLVPFTDWELFLRFSHFARFGYIDSPLAIQRRTPEAVHKKFVVQDKLFMLDLSLKEKANLKNDREALTAVNRGISSHCNNLGWDYLHSGQRMKSLEAYLRGFKETGELAMLMKAATALLPLGVRDRLSSSAKNLRRN
jgi:glycosyltransferase involved in cell wall biosynthesis